MTPLDRRAMLLSTAGGVFLRLAEGQQAQAEQVRALQTTTVDVGGNKITLFKVDDVPVNGADEVKSWSDLITRIVATGYDVDNFNTSFETGAFPKLQNIQAMQLLGGTPALLTHNPRLVEPRPRRYQHSAAHALERRTARNTASAAEPGTSLAIV